MVLMRPTYVGRFFYLIEEGRGEGGWLKIYWLDG